MTTQKASNPQIRCIWALAKVLRLDEEHLHLAVQSITGKGSIATLDNLDAKVVIQELKKQAGQTEKPVPRSKGNVVYLITQKQINYLKYLANSTGRSIKHVEGLSERMFDKKIKQLTTRQASKLIEGCKELFARERKNG